MRVDVHEARRDQLAAGVDLFGSLGRDLADPGNAAVLDRYIRFEQFAAEAVGNAAATDYEIWIGSLWIGSHGVTSLFLILCPDHGLRR